MQKALKRKPLRLKIIVFLVAQWLRIHLATQERDTGLIPDLGRSQMPCAPKQLSPCDTATEPTL